MITSSFYDTFLRLLKTASNSELDLLSFKIFVELSERQANEVINE